MVGISERAHDRQTFTTGLHERSRRMGLAKCVDEPRPSAEEVRQGKENPK